MAASRLGAHQKKAKRLNATIVFWDECGFMMLPIVGRTWAPKGQTPILKHNAKHTRKVSAIGMITISPQRRRLGCYHLLQRDASVNGELVVAVLKQMRRHFKTPLLILWDRLNAHTCAWTTNFLAEHRDVHVEYFPPYTPELNAVEYLWSDTKKNALAQYCPQNVDELESAAAAALKHRSNEQHRLAGYIRHTGLSLRLKIKPQP